MTTVNEEAMTPNSGPPSTAHVVGDMCMMFVSHGINLEEHLMEAQQSASRLDFRLRMARKAIQEGENALDRKDKKIHALSGLLAEAISLLERAVPGTDNQAGRTLWHSDLTDVVVRAHAAIVGTPKQRQTEGMAVPVDTGVDEVVYDHEDALRFKEDHQSACKTIADMHAAAFGGEVRGPERGVVEDVEDLYKRYQAAVRSSCGHAPDGGTHPAAPSAG